MRKLIPFESLKDIELHYSKDETWRFCDSLYTLRKRVQYHEDNLLEIIKDSRLRKLIEQQEQARKENNFQLWTMLGVEFSLIHLDLVDKIDPELAAMMQAMRSQFDIFAQIINVEILEKPKPITESLVAFRAVKNIIPTSKLKTIISDVLKDEHFNYLDDFVNTTKHNFAQNIAMVNYETAVISYERKGKQIPQKDLFWILNSLKPWVNDTMKTLSVELKELQN